MTAYANTDKTVAPWTTMSLSAIYTHTTRANAVAEMVVKALPVLKRMLNVPHNVKVRIAPIKARNVNGRYYNSAKVAVIDCRLGARKALETLCHEMVHAEQYHTGRLSGVGGNIWNGQLIRNRGTTYAAYRALPWEEEAFLRQAGLARQVLEELGELEVVE